MKKTKEEKYELFKEKVITTVKQFYGDDYDISIHPIQKNNGLILNGLNILKRDTHVCPTIYLEDFFDRYEDGCAFSTIFREIVEIYEKYKEPDFGGLDFFTDYGHVKDMLSVKLINAEYNEELLKDVPHRIIQDLAIVVIAEITSSDSHIGSVLIHNNHICMWGIRAVQLIDDAIENSVRKKNVLFSRLADVIMDLYERRDENDIILAGVEYGCGGQSGDCADSVCDDQSDDYADSVCNGQSGDYADNICDDRFDEDSEYIWDAYLSGEGECLYEEPTMYVLTNQCQMFGAAVMTYPGMLEKIGNRLRCNYYIIPSSIHELIILPESITGNATNINEMISSINSEMLSKEEVLSNHAYHYDIDSGRLTSVVDEILSVNQ